MVDHDEGPSLPDNAGVAFHPPVMLLVMILVGFALEQLWPLTIGVGQWSWLIGPIVAASAIVVFIWAVLTMQRGGGSIPTGEPTEAILSSGPYRFSRNPIYLSMVMLLIGIGFWAASFWFLLLAVIAVLLFNWCVISREEIYLERKFDEEYLSYKSRVRRWL